jgi:dienelactone hydrolase
VVFNHGSERNATDLRGQAMFYVRNGFVLFVPHRRGQGLSAAAGEYISDAWERSGRDPAKIVELLDAQVSDVAAAVAYVRRLPYVDGARVALAGCSFGGIQTLLAAERDLGLRAAINFAGGAIIWARTAPLQERMKRAARSARVPVFFLQAANDFDTAPSRILSEEMRRAGRPTRMKIFPPNGKTAMEGHSFCQGGPQPPWGPDVLAFLRETMGGR